MIWLIYVPYGKIVMAHNDELEALRIANARSVDGQTSHRVAGVKPGQAIVIDDLP